MHLRVAHANPDGGIRRDAVLLSHVLLDDDAPPHEFEELELGAELAASDQLEGALGRLILVTGVLQILHSPQEGADARVALGDTRPDALQLLDHGGAARLIGEQEAALIAHGLGRHVLEGLGDLPHRVDVHTTLVGEGGCAHVGRPCRVILIGDLAHEPGGGPDVG